MKKKDCLGYDIFSLPNEFDDLHANNNLFSARLSLEIRDLKNTYEFIKTAKYGKSVMGKDLEYLVIGKGRNKVLYNASHHGNEWITSDLVMRFAREYAVALDSGSDIFGIEASELYEKSKIYIVPMVNPDGVDLASGTLDCGIYYNSAFSMSLNRPDIPFPSGWKANILGVDTNLQYPAGWETAKKIKSEQGIIFPGPRDFTGVCVLEAPESRALWLLTKKISPKLTLSFHSQGEVIYCKYLDIEPLGSRELAKLFSGASGYAVEDVPYASGYAGYKDWYINKYRRPGFTIEVGIGESPLPYSQFDKIYSDNLGIMVLAALDSR